MNDFINKIKVDDDHQGTVLYYEGELVGVVNVQQSTHGLQALWVHDDYRRMGVARQLLKIATTKHGCSQLTIDKTNSAAISLYKSDGWTSYKDDDRYLYMRK